MSQIVEGLWQEIEGQRMDPSANAFLKSWQIPQAELKFEALKALAKREGWEVKVRTPPMFRGAGNQDLGNAAAVTSHDDHTIWIVQPNVSPSTQVYLLLHELGHALGQHSKIRLTPAEYLMLELLGRMAVPKVVLSEAEAELTVALVLKGLGLQRNWSYLKHWDIDQEMLEEVWAGAEGAAAKILGALRPQELAQAA